MYKNIYAHTAHSQEKGKSAKVPLLLLLTFLLYLQKKKIEYYWEVNSKNKLVFRSYKCALFSPKYVSVLRRKNGADESGESNFNSEVVGQTATQRAETP